MGGKQGSSMANMVANVSGGIDMFDTQGNFKKRNKSTRADELKKVLNRFDISKHEISSQLDYIGSQFKSEYFQDRVVGNRGIGAVPFDRTTGRETLAIGPPGLDASERRFEPFNNMPSIASKFKRDDNVAIQIKK